MARLPGFIKAGIGDGVVCGYLRRRELGGHQLDLVSRSSRAQKALPLFCGRRDGGSPSGVVDDLQEGLEIIERLSRFRRFRGYGFNRRSR